MDARLRALCALNVAEAREYCGRHEYDGRLQDLSPDGVRKALAALGGDGQPYDDPYDEALAATREAAYRAAFGELQQHRSNPQFHLANLDVACYDREYAPAADRAAARAEHLAGWPDAVAAAIESLDSVPSPVEAAALAAQARLVEHLDAAARDGEPSAALGADRLALLLSSAEGLPVDLDELSAWADAERDRLRAILDEACA